MKKNIETLLFCTAVKEDDRIPLKNAYNMDIYINTTDNFPF